jgi:hypothetical protein
MATSTAAITTSTASTKKNQKQQQQQLQQQQNIANYKVIVNTITAIATQVRIKQFSAKLFLKPNPPSCMATLKAAITTASTSKATTETTTKKKILPIIINYKHNYSNCKSSHNQNNFGPNCF